MALMMVEWSPFDEVNLCSASDDYLEDFILIVIDLSSV